MIDAIRNATRPLTLSARRGLALTALAIALLAVPLAPPPTAHAQRVDDSLPPLADISIDPDFSPGSLVRWRLTVRNNRVGNHPGTTVRVAQVRITLPDPNGGEETSIWTIRDLKAGGGKVRTISAPRHVALNTGQARVAMRMHAEIIETDPVEPPGFQHNNETEHWAISRSGTNNALFTHGNAGVGVSITGSDRFPAAGAATTFTVHAGNDRGHPYANTQGGDYDSVQFNVRIKINLSPGLTFSNAQQAPAGTTFSTTTGIWDVGTIEAPDTRVYKSLPVAVNLTAHSLTDLPLEERCLTAEVIHAVPWFAFHDDKRANDITTVCLGEDPKALVAKGDIPLFYWLNCVSRTPVLCNDDDTLELLTPLDRAGINRGSDRLNGAGLVGTGRSWSQPESFIVQVKPLEGRYRNRGKWNTGAGDLNLDLNIDQSGFDSTWSGFKESVTVSGADGAAFPGRWRMHNTADNLNYLDATDGTKVEGTSYGFNLIPSDGETPFQIEFETLGTYVALYEIEATRSGTKYTDSATYTFHVGPVADLEVRDAGANPVASTGQRAYTIMALFNGPDIPPAPAVTLTGVPEGAEATPSQGSYDPASGVWNIGEMRFGDARLASGLIEGPTLTLITDDIAGRTITAAIANTQDYSVCIDSDGDDVDAATEAACTATTGNTWHSTEYYDHIPGNNTAAIAARAGTGAPHPDATRDLVVMETRVGNILTWQPVATVNGHAVTHYQVERWDSRWTPLADRVGGTLYLDTAGRANADYRVRAVNIFGVGGPWSITGRPPDMPGNFRVDPSGSGNAAVLSWTEPASPSPITGYVIDISDSAAGDSRTNDATVGGGVTTWTHTGLGAGDVKFYRVQARNRDGVGRWTAWQSVGAGPGAPGGLRARANGPGEIVLTWNAAPSRDVPIYEYELEYSNTSASEGYEWNFLQTVLQSEGLRHVDDTVDHGSTRYYRVRARTLQGNVAGAWSNVAGATTSAAGPSPPLNVTADYEIGNTENGILLTWEASASLDASYYRIEHSTDDGATWESESARHTATCDVGGTTKFCYTDRGLFSGTEHWYRVAGVNRSGAVGEWARSNSHLTQGEPTEAPGEPQNLRITGVSGRQVSLAWDAPMDNGGSRVTGYEYMVESACVHDAARICRVIEPTRVGGTSRTLTVPNVRGHYDFSVRALNAVGAGQWTQPVSQYVDPQRTWRVTLSPSRLTVDEGGEATYRVRLTADPGRPVLVALHWEGDDDLGNTLSYQQFKWLLPSNYANENPDLYLDPEWTAAWNVGVTITVTADEDADSENGTLEVHTTVYYVSCADLGNPAGCVDDPEDTGVTAYITVTERDND